MITLSTRVLVHEIHTLGEEGVPQPVPSFWEPQDQLPQTGKFCPPIWGSSMDCHKEVLPPCQPHAAVGPTTSLHGAASSVSMPHTQRQAPAHLHMHKAPHIRTCPLCMQLPGDHSLSHEDITG